MNSFPKPTMLMILDGFGINENTRGNAIAAADTPNLDKIFASYPHTQLDASGLAVGFRGRPPQHWRRAHSLSGTYENNKENRRRHFF